MSLKTTQSYFNLKKGSIADLYTKISLTRAPIGQTQVDVSSEGKVQQQARQAARPVNPTHLDDDGFVPIRKKR